MDGAPGVLGRRCGAGCVPPYKLGLDAGEPTDVGPLGARIGGAEGALRRASVSGNDGMLPFEPAPVPLRAAWGTVVTFWASSCTLGRPAPLAWLAAVP